MVRLKSCIGDNGRFELLVLGQTSHGNKRRVVLGNTSHELKAVKFVLYETTACQSCFQFEIRNGVGIFRATAKGNLHIPITSSMTLTDTDSDAPNFIEVTSSGGTQRVPLTVIAK